MSVAPSSRAARMRAAWEGDTAMLRSRIRASSEDPFAVKPREARNLMTSPPEVVARCLACALTCGCHSDSVSFTRAAWRRLFGLVEAPER
ncbi:hypothetical protein GCM10010300_85720 [Streptomyces olivaceoviridis]|nr:hypothetical protein GCM10010300_85720 [Streptomyces olivaceoviridis]